MAAATTIWTSSEQVHGQDVPDASRSRARSWTCSVCLDSYDDDNACNSLSTTTATTATASSAWQALPCGHVIHVHCWEQLCAYAESARIDTKCPLCRERVYFENELDATAPPMEIESQHIDFDTEQHQPLLSNETRLRLLRQESQFRISSHNMGGQMSNQEHEQRMARHLYELGVLHRMHSLNGLQSIGHSWSVGSSWHTDPAPLSPAANIQGVHEGVAQTMFEENRFNFDSPIEHDTHDSIAQYMDISWMYPDDDAMPETSRINGNEETVTNNDPSQSNDALPASDIYGNTHGSLPEVAESSSIIGLDVALSASEYQMSSDRPPIYFEPANESGRNVEQRLQSCHHYNRDGEMCVDKLIDAIVTANDLCATSHNDTRANDRQCSLLESSKRALFDSVQGLCACCELCLKSTCPQIQQNVRTRLYDIHNDVVVELGSINSTIALNVLRMIFVQSGTNINATV